MDPVKVLAFARIQLVFVCSLMQLLESDVEIVNGPESPSPQTDDSTGSQTLHEIDNAFHVTNREVYAEDLSPGRIRKEKWSEDVWAFNDIAKVCREDFEKVRTVLEHVRKSNPSSTSWPTFRQALQSHLYPNELSDLEMRCKKSWTDLTLRIHSFTSIWIERYQPSCNAVRDQNEKHRAEIPEHFRNQIGYSAHFEAMSRLLKDVSIRAVKLKTSRYASLEDVDVCRNNLYAFVTEQESVRGEQAVLDSLAFDVHAIQIKSIPPAVGSMFEWVFSSTESPRSPRHGSDLRKWLRQESSLGIVLGESGCGKSMLLKYIFMHPDLDGTLYRWSNPKPVIVANHFFCKTGTRMQRSLQGMLQSLLRSVLLQLPRNIDAIYAKHGSGYPESLRDHVWTVEDLQADLLEVLKSRQDIKYCIFIDGIDQSDDPPMVVSFLRTLLTTTGNGKACVSSTRDDLGDLFSTGCTTFRIGDDFLHNDLEVYIAHLLQSHPWYCNRSSASERGELIRIAANKYQNFLWARIAVEQLCSQYQSGHTFEAVKRSLYELPSQPRALVCQRFRTISEDLAPSAACFFLIALAAKSPPPLAVYHFLTMEQQDPDYALRPLPTARSHDVDLLPAQDLLEKRCNGLLQVRPDLRVGFPHTIIHEMFNSPEFNAGLQAKVEPSRPKVHLSLCRAYLAYMKGARLSWGRPTFSYAYLKKPSVLRIFGEFLTIARELKSDRNMFRLLGDWESCFLAKSESDQRQLSANDRVKVNWSKHFLQPILDAQLTDYVAYKLRKQPNFAHQLNQCVEELHMPALSLVLGSLFDAHESRRGDHMKMLLCLLKHDCSPNQAYSAAGIEFTPWTDLVRRASRRPADFRWSLRTGLFSRFLDHKADPNTPVWDSHPHILGTTRRAYTSSWVVLVFHITESLRGGDVLHEETYRQDCLELLGKLCEAGANAEWSPSSQFYDSREASGGTEWAEPLLSHLLDDESSHFTASITLRARLVERIFYILAKPDGDPARPKSDIGWIWPLLRRWLPADLLQMVQDNALLDRKVSQNGNELSRENSNPAKRSSETMARDNETSPKRARSETQDEPMTIAMAMSVDREPARIK